MKNIMIDTPMPSIDTERVIAYPQGALPRSLPFAWRTTLYALLTAYAAVCVVGAVMSVVSVVRFVGIIMMLGGLL